MIDKRIVFVYDVLLSVLFIFFMFMFINNERLGYQITQRRTFVMLSPSPHPLGCETKGNCGLKPRAFPSNMGN